MKTKSKKAYSIICRASGILLIFSFMIVFFSCRNCFAKDKTLPENAPRPKWSKEWIPMRSGCLWIYGSPFHFDNLIKSRTQTFILLDRSKLGYLAKVLCEGNVNRLSDLSDMLFRGQDDKIQNPILAALGGALIHEPFDQKENSVLDELVLCAAHKWVFLGALEIQEDSAKGTLRLIPLQEKDQPTVTNGKYILDWNKLPNGFMGLSTNTMALLPLEDRVCVTVGGAVFDAARGIETRNRSYVFSEGIGFIAQYISSSYRPEPIQEFVRGEPDALYKNNDFPKLACISRILYYRFPGSDAVEWINSDWIQKDQTGKLCLCYKGEMLPHHDKVLK